MEHFEKPIQIKVVIHDKVFRIWIEKEAIKDGVAKEMFLNLCEKAYDKAIRKDL